MWRQYHSVESNTLIQTEKLLDEILEKFYNMVCI